MHMRKSRPTLVSNYGVKGDCSLHFGSAAADSPMHNYACCPTSLSDNELAIGRPAWADFDMEIAFWKILHHICSREGLSGPEFVGRAQANYSGISIDSAVRLHIISHIQKNSGFYCSDRAVAAQSLHESI